MCRQLRVSEAMFYIWKKKYGNLGASEQRQLGQLRDENMRLKRLVADLTLDRHFKKRSCWLAPLHRVTLYYRSRAKDQSVLRMRIRDLAHSRPRFGYERILILLRCEGWLVGRNRVHRQDQRY